MDKFLSVLKNFCSFIHDIYKGHYEVILLASVCSGGWLSHVLLNSDIIFIMPESLCIYIVYPFVCTTGFINRLYVLVRFVCIHIHACASIYL